MSPESDRVTVPIPTHDWAQGAIRDLRREGLSAELVGQDARGQWLLRIEGPAESIAEIRYQRQPRGAPVCWEAFVNDAVGELRTE